LDFQILTSGTNIYILLTQETSLHLLHLHRLLLTWSFSSICAFLAHCFLWLCTVVPIPPRNMWLY